MCYHSAMDLLDILRHVGTLVLAVLLGALIGFERERHDRPAGLRTHILVCMGSALITLVSRDMAGTRFDPGRIAAQIVSGIGFLGAGTIFRQGSLVRGLTTAASLWVIAGVGMATAAGPDSMVMGTVAALIVFFTLSVVNRIEDNYIPRRSFRSLTLTMDGDREHLGEILLGVMEYHVEVRRVQVQATESGLLTAQLRLRTPAAFSAQKVGAWLGQQPGVVSFEWE
jgi:putative Mg2+ transporter-C (MgtC) family protein